MTGFDSFIDLDKALFITLNGYRHTLLDPVMIILSNTWVWTPLYLFLVGHIIRIHRQASFRIILSILIVFFLTDLGTSTLLKPYFERLRPCHDLSLDGLYTLLGNCGGKFGFPSGHAANTMGLAISVFLLHNKKIGCILIFWSLSVAYSRIYLGVHFPLDVLCGLLFGALTGWMSYLLNQKLFKAD